MKALNKLPKVEIMAIKAVVLDGMSLRQAGRKLNLSAMTVHRRVKRGLSRLAGAVKTPQPLL